MSMVLFSSVFGCFLGFFRFLGFDFDIAQGETERRFKASYYYYGYY